MNLLLNTTKRQLLITLGLVPRRLWRRNRYQLTKIIPRCLRRGDSLIKYKNLFFFLMMILLFSCRQDQGIIMTVNGPIQPDEMGFTLTHEHVMVDWLGADSTGSHRWQRDTVIN